jgi:hypothetical protein
MPTEDRGNLRWIGMALAAPVGPQLFNLAIHLIEDRAYSLLQPCPTVVGETSGQSPRLFK